MHAVWSGEGDMILETAKGKHETFNPIIFVCHSGNALRILNAGSDTTPVE
jgi:predicted NAD/FAD-binding protein